MKGLAQKKPSALMTQEKASMKREAGKQFGIHFLTIFHGQSDPDLKQRPVLAALKAAAVHGEYN